MLICRDRLTHTHLKPDVASFPTGQNNPFYQSQRLTSLTVDARVGSTVNPEDADLLVMSSRVVAPPVSGAEMTHTTTGAPFTPDTTTAQPYTAEVMQGMRIYFKIHLMSKPNSIYTIDRTCIVLIV